MKRKFTPPLENPLPGPTASKRRRLIVNNGGKDDDEDDDVQMPHPDIALGINKYVMSETSQIQFGIICLWIQVVLVKNKYSPHYLLQTLTHHHNKTTLLMTPTCERINQTNPQNISPK